MAWNRKLWADRSRDFISKTLLRQEEFQQSLLKRAWVEEKVRDFTVSPLFQEACAAENTQLADRLASIRPRVLLYGSSIAGTAFEHADADFAVVFPISSPLNSIGAAPVEISDTAENLASIPVGAMGFVGGMATFPRQAQPTVLTSLYDHVMKQSKDKVGTAPRMQRIFRARIPILQYVPSLGELQERNSKLGADSSDLPQAMTAVHSTDSATSKKEHYDISLSVDGSRNSLLIRQYMKLYPALRVACLVLKQWGRQQKILNARRGWISPYALTMYKIHYALEAKVIAAPIPPDSIDEVLAQISQQMCSTTEDASGSRALYGVDDMDTTLPMDFDHAAAFEGVSDIIKGFCEYYGGVNDQFDFDANVVDIRTERRVLSKEDWFSKEETTGLSDAEKWHRVGYGVLMIRDPFEKHSLGRSVEFFRSESIREEMRLAAKGSIQLETLLPL
ncbi:Hypothetical protein, putative [Bodo saltans]|uniref:RNA uridylyltransferase n=1 Tax=Bodo saltans TaxID=75058 RepID=A0A0S4IUE3_BODSA|nr:Hypothetical protein, putative [Bodo saltans]|eukprot:CUF95979.1 Hypothetical protein, putative [Bodo saltans]